MKLLGPLSLLLAMAGASSAATIVQTKSFAYVPAGSEALVFNKFDNSLGTLTSIVITTNVTKSGGSLFVDNENDVGASGNISQSVTVSLGSSQVTLFDSAFQPIGSNITALSLYSVTVGPDDGDGFGVQPGGPDYDGTFFGPVSVSNSGTVGFAFYPGYQALGGGTFTINVNGTQGFDTSVVSGAAAAITPAAVSGDVTITYNYEAVPEPSAALLGALGMLGLFIRRR